MARRPKKSGKAKPRAAESQKRGKSGAPRSGSPWPARGAMLLVVGALGAGGYWVGTRIFADLSSPPAKVPRAAAASPPRAPKPAKKREEPALTAAAPVGRVREIPAPPKLEPPPKAAPPESEGDAVLRVTAWGRECARPEGCTEKHRLHARIVVRDASGERASAPISSGGAPATFLIPHGRYEVIAIDDTGRASPPSPVDLREGAMLDLHPVIER